jgi:hypothetical protein
METRSQIRAAALGVASALVLILSLFLDWYKLDLPERIQGREIAVPSYNAFEGLERADVALAIAAALGLILAALILARVMADSPLPGLALLGVALFALAVVIYRGTNRPPREIFGGEVDTTLQFGWFVSLVAAGLLAIAGLWAYLAGPRLDLEGFALEEDEEPERTEEPREGREAP